MNLWLVIPAWRRYAVTNLALAQQAHLRGVLAARGITCRSVVVADDDNVDIAREHGCDVLERPNDSLGRKVNDGFEYACTHGADYVGFTGSDDWLHPDLFDPLLEQEIPEKVIAGHLIAIVDLVGGRLRKLGIRGPDGVSPWLIPRWALAQSRFRPVDDAKSSGMEGCLRRGLGFKADWLFHDPHDLCRVDFKSDVGMTPYDRVAKLFGYGDEVSNPWPLLATRYPADLVALAERTHQALAFEVAA